MYEDSQLRQASFVLPIEEAGKDGDTGGRGWGLLGGSAAPGKVHLNERRELQQRNSQSCPTNFGTGSTAHSLGKRSSCLRRSFSVPPRHLEERRWDGDHK